MVLDPHLAVAFSNEEKVLSCRPLLDDGVLRHVEQSGNIMDQKVSQVLVISEYFICHDGIVQNMLGDLESETGTDDVEKLVQLLLAVKIILRHHHEFSDAGLQDLWQLHVLHGGVRHVDLLLEYLRLPVEGGHNNSYCSENIGVYKGSTDHKDTADQVLVEIGGHDVSSSKRQQRIVEGYHVLHHEMVIEDAHLRSIVLILRRLPGFVDLCKVKK